MYCQGKYGKFLLELLGRIRKHIKGKGQDKPALFKDPGNDLLSHGVAPEVSSALKGLTSVFGMVTGGSPSL